MSESEPCMEVNLGGELVELTRHNTSLFTHLGEHALFDHIYVLRSEDPPQGTYIPSTAQMYPVIRDFLRENRYPRHEDLTEASEVDQRVITAFWLRDLVQSEGIPEEWEDGAA